MKKTILLLDSDRTQGVLFGELFDGYEIIIEKVFTIEDIPKEEKKYSLFIINPTSFSDELVCKIYDYVKENNIPLIIVTAIKPIEDRFFYNRYKKIFDYATAILLKPYDLSEVIGKVGKALSPNIVLEEAVVA